MTTSLFIEIEQEWHPTRAITSTSTEKHTVTFHRSTNDDVLATMNVREGDEVIADGPNERNENDLLDRMFVATITCEKQTTVKLGSVNVPLLEEWIANFKGYANPKTNVVDQKKDRKSSKKIFPGKGWRRSGSERKIIIRSEIDKNPKLSTSTAPSSFSNTRIRSVSASPLGGGSGAPGGANSGSVSPNNNGSYDYTADIRKSTSKREPSSESFESFACLPPFSPEFRKVPDFVFADIESVSDVESDDELEDAAGEGGGGERGGGGESTMLTGSIQEERSHLPTSSSETESKSLELSLKSESLIEETVFDSARTATPPRTVVDVGRRPSLSSQLPTPSTNSTATTEATNEVGEGANAPAPAPVPAPAPAASVAQQEKKNDKEDARRRNIVNELLATEESYVHGLQMALNHYFTPLQDNAEAIGITTDILNRIFVNIQMLLAFNVKMLNEIKKTVTDWNPDSRLGPIFVKMGPFLKMYTAYSNKYSQSNDLLQTTKKNNPKFKAFLLQCQTQSGSSLALEDFLIMPIQRIPRYSLLIKDLLSHTSTEHEDYKFLSTSLDSIAQVAKHINEEVRKTENQQKIEEMTEKGINLINLIKPHRHLLKEGIVNVKLEITGPLKSCSGSKSVKEVQHWLLFNDIFVHVKKDLLTKSGSSSNVDLSQPQFICDILLIWVKTKHSKATLITPSFTMKFSSKDWVEAILSTQQAHFDLLNKSKLKFKNIMEGHRFATFLFPERYGTYTGQWLDGKRDGQGTWVMDGGVYRGHWKDDKQDGKGKLSYITGEVYVGQWSEGVQNGKGELRLTDNTRYIGNWSRGLRKGKGKVIYSNGDIFEGNWRGDKINGDGRLRCNNGVSYTGQWVDGLYSGVGKITFPNGVTYEGEWFQGMKQGMGILTFSNTKYEGEFKENMRNGRGSYVDAESYYDGFWVNGSHEGLGIKKYVNLGSVYEGDWLDAKRHGFGRYIYPDGAFYSGMWENDKRNGEGTYKGPKGQYKGTWLNDKWEGKGTLTMTCGATYSGMFSQGKMNKTGCYFGGEGDFIVSYEGEWSNGQIHGKGTLILRNGDTYKGSFTRGVFDGQGTVISSNGSVCTGKWIMGLADGKMVLETPSKSQIHGTVMSNMIIPMSGPALFLSPLTPLLQSNITGFKPETEI